MAVANCLREDSPPQIKPYQKKVSTAFAVGDIVFVDANGFLDKAAAATTATSIVGVIMQNILSTDADYAVATPVAVDVFTKGNNADLFRLQVGTGTPAQTHVGETHDLSAAGKADLAATTTNVIKVQRILSATEVLVSFV